MTKDRLDNTEASHKRTDLLTSVAPFPERPDEQSQWAKVSCHPEEGLLLQDPRPWEMMESQKLPSSTNSISDSVRT